jgi:hypothetical protein
LLVDLPRPTTGENITKVFEAYYDQRAKIAKAALANSRQFGKVMGDRVCIEVWAWMYRPPAPLTPFLSLIFKPSTL